jgi:hypothetical protein
MLTFPKTPITDASFRKWNAIKHEEESEETGEIYHYYILPLPNNWDGDMSARPALLSTASDEYNIIGVKKGEYKISVFDYGELPLLETEEDVELLYKIVTQENLVKRKK